MLEGIPIARDRAGNTLVRVPYDRGTEWGVEVASPAKGMIFSLYSPEDKELSRIAIEMDWEEGRADVWNLDSLLEDPMSVKWIRWIFLRFLRINIFEEDTGHLQVEILAPNMVPSGTWSGIDRVLSEGNVEDMSRVIELPLDPKGDRLKQGQEFGDVIEKALMSSSLVGEYGIIERGYLKGFAFISSWVISMRHLGLVLDVYRQGQENGTVRVAYALSSVGSGLLKIDLTRFSLLDVLRDSGVWIEANSFDVWLDEHMVQAEWLIDSSKLELYSLLGVPSPLFWEYGRCKEWAGYQE